ncbi:MAG TPA: TIGR00153 family protein [Archaeoglobaceae archaeon]|nr:TIGR00153 family protein [Archaeoglobaceae archaeon]
MVGLFKRIVGGKKEAEVLEKIREHLSTVKVACEIFFVALEKNDSHLLKEVCELEKMGDTIRREIALLLYEGAFLPAIRGDLYYFSEIVDEIFDTLEDTAIGYTRLLKELPPEIREKCIRVSKINLKMSKHLISAFDALGEEEDLKDKTIRIRAAEREVDIIKNDIIKNLVKIDVKNYWEGKTLSDFVEDLVDISDVIENAADLIQILNVSLR